MRQAIRLALRGKGRVSPNPMVGAVLVKHGRVLARGFHRKFGDPHAEVDCLRRVDGDLRDSTLYVNLEPCSHLGKTPPCVDLLLSRGVGTVVAAMKDPNPLVAGRGLEKLRRGGVHISVGVLEEEALALNYVFTKHITTRRPYIHVKIAQSRDGRISGGHTRWISSLQSRRRVHVLRAEFDAVLVGAGTVRVDNPSLSVRAVKGRDPDVVILDGALSLSPRRTVFAPTGSRRVFLFTTKSALRGKSATAREFAARGTTVIALQANGGRLGLHQVMRELYKRNVASVLVEGGAHVFTQFLAERLVDELTLFVSPNFFGNGLAAISSGTLLPMARQVPERVAVGRSGRDLMLNVRF